MSNDNPFLVAEAKTGSGGGTFNPAARNVDAGSGLNWLLRAWEMFKQAPGPWIVIAVVFTIIIVVVGAIPFIGLLINLLIPILSGGVMIACRAQEEGGTPSLSHLFAGFSGHAGNLVLVGVVYLAGMFGIAMLAVLLGAGGVFAAIAGGGNVNPMAFLLPALAIAALGIPLAMAVWFAPALVVFNGVPPFDAMKASFAAGIKNVLPFLVYGLVLLVLAVIASIPLMLGWLILGPVLTLSVYTSYRDLFYGP